MTCKPTYMLHPVLDPRVPNVEEEQCYREMLHLQE